MPNIMVFNTAASKGGALSVLEDFYNQALLCGSKHTHWFFVVSTPKLEEAENAAVLRYAWVKKSWIHRLFFDFFIARSLVKKYNIDSVFSMQNITFPRLRVPQTVYLHNCLAFISKRFRFSESLLLWVNQKIIGKLIKKSAVKAQRIIVQTNWMKQALIQKTNIQQGKVFVIPPKVSRKHIIPYSDRPEYRKTFFYPAEPLPHKNHQVVLEACLLISKHDYDCRVIFTFNGDENMTAKNALRFAKEHGLNIEFAGALTRSEVFGMYAKSTLIFPSIAETFGMPLLEARLSGAFICVSDLPFGREVLCGYKNAQFFDPYDSSILAGVLMNMQQREYYKETYEPQDISLISVVTGK